MSPLHEVLERATSRIADCAHQVMRSLARRCVAVARWDEGRRPHLHLISRGHDRSGIADSPAASPHARTSGPALRDVTPSNSPRWPRIESRDEPPASVWPRLVFCENRLAGLQEFHSLTLVATPRDKPGTGGEPRTNRAGAQSRPGLGLAFCEMVWGLRRCHAWLSSRWARHLFRHDPVDTYELKTFVADLFSFWRDVEFPSDPRLAH